MLTRSLFLLALALGASPLQSPAPAAFDPARWDVLDPAAQRLDYLGRPSLFLDNGLALQKASTFGDGTIDVDIAIHGHASFGGIAFRAEGADDYELIYVRPHLSRRPDALQYTPIFNGSEAW